MLCHKLLDKERSESWSVIITEESIREPKFKQYYTHSFKTAPLIFLSNETG